MKRNKAITILKKLYIEKSNIGNKKIPKDERLIYLEPSSCLGIVPKTIEARDFLLNNFDVGEGNKNPELDYKIKDSDVNKEIISKYSTMFLKTILEFINVFANDEEGVKLSIKEDYPLRVILKEYEIVLAPRISND